VLVRGDAPAKDAQAGVAIAFLHVAEHLIVSAVFLDDVNHVLEHARFTGAFWHGPRSLAGPRRQSGLREQRITQIGQRGFRVFLQMMFRRDGNQRKRAAILVRIVSPSFALARTRLFHFGADAFEVGNTELFAARVKHNGAGKPAGRNQAEQFRFARFEPENSDGVLCAVANEERFARLVERQRIRLRAEQIARILPRANGFDDPVGARVNDAQRVTAGVGHDEPAPVRRQRKRTGAQAGHHFRFRILAFGFRVEVNH